MESERHVDLSEETEVSNWFSAFDVGTPSLAVPCASVRVSGLDVLSGNTLALRGRTPLSTTPDVL